VKKAGLLVIILVMVIAMAVPVMAATNTMHVVSGTGDTGVQVIGVYNKAGGVSNYIDLHLTPFNAVLADEPTDYPKTYSNEPPTVQNSVWDSGTNYFFQNSGDLADWIWETPRAEDPAGYASSNPSLYDSNASSNGRAVVFQKQFMLPGTPTSAVLNITADNCYEVWINGKPLARSATAKQDGWANNNMDETWVASRHWQDIGTYTINVSDLKINDTNTIKIIAGNEFYHQTIANYEDNNVEVPPYQPYEAGPPEKKYFQQNPAGLIFQMDITYDTPVNPPVPEFPAGALLGIGLVGLLGFCWFGYSKSHSTKA
jgi:hypothetical protein